MRKIWCNRVDAEYVREHLNVPNCRTLVRVDRKVRQPDGTTARDSNDYPPTLASCSDLRHNGREFLTPTTMRFRLKLKLNTVELDMTPMIDVVFLLIVFFTLVINFTAADQNERIKLPVSEWAQPPEEQPAHQMTLHVLANGEVIYDGDDHPLHRLLEPLRRHISFLDFMNVPAKDVTVIIRGDAQCETGTILDVKELCLGLGLERIVLRTKQQEE